METGTNKLIKQFMRTLTKLKRTRTRQHLEALALAYLAGATTIILLIKFIN